MATISRALGYATLLGTMSVHATNYYVDSSLGADTNAGSETTPWKTLAKVNSTGLLPGDTVFFKRGGVWAETLTPPASGADGSPIIFDAYGSGELPTITGKINGNCIFWSAPRSHLIFRNLHLRDCGQPDGTNVGGINVYSSAGVSSNILIENSIIEGSQTWNIYMNGMSNLIIRNNVIRGAELQHGIYLSGGYGISGAIIEGNDIYNNKAMCVQFNSNGKKRLTGVVMRYNLLHDCQLGGINNIGAEAANIYYNIIYGVMPGIYNSCDQYDTGCAYGATGGIYVNNTIQSIGATYATCFNNRSSVGDPDFAAFINNICWHDAPSGAALSDSETTGNPLVEHNLFYSPRGDLQILRRNVLYFTFTSYLQARPGDVGQLFGDPKFINASAGDFGLFPGSPAIDSGINRGMTRDIAQTVVPSGTAPDRGAVEHAESEIILPIGAPYNLRVIQ